MAWTEHVLVTGGAGFIGSWVARGLAEAHPSYLVVVYDAFAYTASPLNLTEPAPLPNIHIVEGDVCDGIALARLFREYRFSYVVHMAAETHVDQSFDNAARFVNVNVVGTQVVLETVRRSGAERLKRFVQFSTDEVYGEAAPGAQNVETDPLLPSNPYAAAKGAADLLVHAYMQSFRIPASTVRCTNVYGPKQYPEKIVPKFLTNILRGDACELQGSGAHERTYIYAADVARAVDTVLHHGEVGGVYNIGSDSVHTNRAVLDLLLRAVGLDPADPVVQTKFVAHTRDRPYNDRRYALDYTKLRELGWEPRVTFEAGLAETADWYTRHGQTWWAEML